jgi:hypothetical protein
MNTHYLLRQGGWLDDDLPIHTQFNDSPTRKMKVKGNTPIELSTQGNIDDSVTVGWYKLSDPEDIPTFPSISLLTHEDTLSTKRKDTLSTKRKDRFKRTGKYNRWNSQCSSASSKKGTITVLQSRTSTTIIEDRRDTHQKKSRSKNDRYSRGKEYVRKSVNPKVGYSKYRKNKTKDSEIHRSKSCNSDKSVNVTGI